MTAPATVVAGLLGTLAVAAGALLAGPVAGASHATAPGVVPRVDPRMAAINRRTRELLDQCHARTAAAGVLVVVTTASDGRLGLVIRPAPRGVCAYRVGP